MDENPDIVSNYKFKYPLRDYQVRALSEVQRYIEDDGKIHIVAAPGAGKTSLALQIVLDLGKPTLVLVPTVTLRDQWLERFKSDFTEGGDLTDVISDDLNDPKQITAVTYQSLYADYAAVMRKNKAPVVIEKLIDAGIGLIVLDEAHHLKSAWLDATNRMIREIGDVMTISLTATPPYDLKQSFWEKYTGLCGEIDVEITVPELIRKRDLAEHQDYVYFNYPTQNQSADLKRIHLDLSKFIKKIVGSAEFVTALSLHDGIVNLDSKIDYFIDHFDYYLAIRKFLFSNKIALPENGLMIDDGSLPRFGLADLELLLTYCLFQDAKSYTAFSGFFRKVRKELNGIGAIVDKKVKLKEVDSLRKQVTQNIGKLNSIKEILKAEQSNLGSKLKLVVISDNIYQHALDLWDEEEFKQIGVLPIFASIVRGQIAEVIVLTGEIILIPARLKEKLLRITSQFGIKEAQITMDMLNFDFDYVQVRFSGNTAKKSVGIITRLFKESDVHVLVGSNAFIGEGWDAPFINSLIMATSIASFVTSNQVRGRAIRTNEEDPDKAANIWHLVCVEKCGKESYVLGEDYEILKRRFKSFEGIGLDEPLIDYEIDRLDIKEKVYNSAELAELNKRTLSYAGNRAQMRASWKQALVSYQPVKINKLREEVEVGTWRKTRSVGLVFSYLGLGQLIFSSLKTILKEHSSSVFSLRNGALYFIGKGILQTLIYMGVINPGAELVFLKRYGETGFRLRNSTLRENTDFKEAFMEMISPIKNPRYLIKIKKTYFPVPKLIGANKKQVNFLLHALHRPKNSQLIFTKNPEGKRQLLMIKLKQSKVTVTENVKKGETKLQFAQTGINVQVLEDELKSKNLYREEM